MLSRAGIDDLVVRCRGTRLDIQHAIDSLAPHQTEDYSIGTIRRRSIYHLGGSRYRHSYSVYRDDVHLADFGVVGGRWPDSCLPLLIHVRKVWRLESVSRLGELIREFCWAPNQNHCEIVRADLFVDREVDEAEHRSVCLSRRFRDRTDPEFRKVSRRYGSNHLGSVRIYDKATEQQNKGREVTADSLWRVEVGCHSRRLKNLLGLGRPVRLPDLWAVGRVGSSPFRMIRQYRFRDLAPQAKHRYAYHQFREQLNEVGMQAVYNFASRHRCVNTWLEETGLADRLTGYLQDGLEQFFGFGARGYRADELVA